MNPSSGDRVRALRNPWLLFRAPEQLVVCVLAASSGPVIADLEAGVPDHATGGIRQLRTPSNNLSALRSQLMLGGRRLASLEFSDAQEVVSDKIQRNLDLSTSLAIDGAVDHPDEEIHRRLASKDETGTGDGGPARFEAIVSDARWLQDVSPAPLSPTPAPARDGEVPEAAATSDLVSQIHRVAASLAARRGVANTGGYAVARTPAPTSAVTLPSVPTPAPTPAVVAPPTPGPTSAVIATPGPTSVMMPTPAPTSAVIPTPAPTSSVIATPGPTYAVRALPTVGSTSDVFLTPGPTSAVIATPASTSVVVATPRPTSAAVPTPGPTYAVRALPTVGPTSDVFPTPGPTSAVLPTPAPTSSVIATPAPASAVPEETCGSYVNNNGGTLCPGGFSPVGSGVPCGTGTDCNQATCCEALPPPTPAPLLTTVPTASPTSAPTITLDEIVDSTTAAGAVSVLTAGGLVVTTVSTLFGGTAGGLVSSASTSAATSLGPNAVVETTGGVSSTASVRQPSATLTFVLIAQIQFLATLALVDNTGAISRFAEKLRWVNLWPPASFAESFTPVSEPRSEGSLSSDDIGRGEGATDVDSDVASSSTSNLSSAVFMGNLTLFVVLLSSIFLAHVALASAVEAYWLAKTRAHEEIIRLSQLSSRTSGREIQHDPDTGASSKSSLLLGSNGADGGPANDGDEEGGGVMPRSTWLNMSKIVECRERSQSAWLHFPHVELVFLLFAFEGAVVAQVSALRENASPAVFSLALAYFLLYPVLMTVMITRTFASQVRAADNIVFKPKAEENTYENERGYFSSARNFVARVGTSLKENHSMFAWADKGQWESVETEDKQVQRERDWFRIGFEPTFVDFTGKGAWFVVYSLIEWAALGAVGVVIEESVLQLSLFCAIHTVSFLLLLVLKPFANWIINAMGLSLYGIDAACMAMLAVSAAKWEGSPRAKEVDSAVVIMQLIALSAIIIPIYVDTAVMIFGALWERLCKPKQESEAQTDENPNKEEERIFTNRYIRSAWGRLWCIMLRKNIFVCFRDTAAGVSSKAWASTATAAQTGPYPPQGFSNTAEPEGFQPRRPGGNSIGTANTPVVVLPPRSEAIGRDADA